MVVAVPVVVQRQCPVGPDSAETVEIPQLSTE